MAPRAPDHAESFPPLLGPAPRVLILGSLPGRASLAAGEYYAHPRNRFWWVMGALFEAGRELPYAERGERLRTRGIALWDVVQAARRPGSLDAAIERASLRHNDIAQLLKEQPTLAVLAFCLRAWRVLQDSVPAAV